MHPIHVLASNKFMIIRQNLETLLYENLQTLQAHSQNIDSKILLGILKNFSCLKQNNELNLTSFKLPFIYQLFKKNSVFYHEGAPSNRLYFIMKGKASIFIPKPLEGTEMNEKNKKIRKKKKDKSKGKVENDMHNVSMDSKIITSSKSSKNDNNSPIRQREGNVSTMEVHLDVSSSITDDEISDDDDNEKPLHPKEQNSKLTTIISDKQEIMKPINSLLPSINMNNNSNNDNTKMNIPKSHPKFDTDQAERDYKLFSLVIDRKSKYIVRNGLLRVSYLRSQYAGECLGLITSILGATRNHIAIAAEDTHVLSIEREDFIAIFPYIVNKIREQFDSYLEAFEGRSSYFEILKFFHGLSEREYNNNDTIYQEGDSYNRIGIYIIIQGEISIQKRFIISELDSVYIQQPLQINNHFLRNNQQIEMKILGRNDIFGQEVFLNQKYRKYTAICKSNHALLHYIDPIHLARIKKLCPNLYGYLELKALLDDCEYEKCIRDILKASIENTNKQIDNQNNIMERYEIPRMNNNNIVMPLSLNKNNIFLPNEKESKASSIINSNTVLSSTKVINQRRKNNQNKNQDIESTILNSLNSSIVNDSEKVGESRNISKSHIKGLEIPNFKKFINSQILDTITPVREELILNKLKHQKIPKSIKDNPSLSPEPTSTGVLKSKNGYLNRFVGGDHSILKDQKPKDLSPNFENSNDSKSLTRLNGISNTEQHQKNPFNKANISKKIDFYNHIDQEYTNNDEQHILDLLNSKILQFPSSKNETISDRNTSLYEQQKEFHNTSCSNNPKNPTQNLKFENKSINFNDLQLDKLDMPMTTGRCSSMEKTPQLLRVQQGGILKLLEQPSQSIQLINIETSLSPLRKRMQNSIQKKGINETEMNGIQQMKKDMVKIKISSKHNQFRFRPKNLKLLERYTPKLPPRPGSLTFSRKNLRKKLEENNDLVVNMNDDDNGD